MATELLKRGADSNKDVGAGGSTPLHLAILQDRPELVEELLRKGAHLETENDSGHTPLMVAVTYGVSEDMINILLKQGEDVHTSQDMKTSLQSVACSEC